MGPPREGGYSDGKLSDSLGPLQPPKDRERRAPWAARGRPPGRCVLGGGADGAEGAEGDVEVPLAELHGDGEVLQERRVEVQARQLRGGGNGRTALGRSLVLCFFCCKLRIKIGFQISLE